MVSFANPWALLLLPMLAAILFFARRGRGTSLLFSRTPTLRGVADSRARWLARVPGWLRIAVLVLLIVALAAPRTGASVIDADAEGIAIVITLDISSSMLAEDFENRNRLTVAKEKIASFIAGREFDRIGLVAFAGEALTQVPVTIDYPVVYRALDQLQAGAGLLEDGTAIGTAIATAANRLRRAPGKSLVMILMTDGENNRGQIDPVTAARAAAAFDIKIYTIGVGSEGVAPVPVASGPFGIQYANLPVHIDERLLREIADLTNGRYFRATNEAGLDSIYDEIDRLEKSTVQVRRYVNYTPHHLPFVILALTLLGAEWTVRGSRWGRVP